MDDSAKRTQVFFYERMLMLAYFSRFSFILAALLVLVLTTGAAGAAEATPPRARVIEVIKQYCKLAAPEGHQVAVGAEGTLHRGASDEDALGKVVITAVEEDYIVGKVTGEAPRPGDYVVIERKESPAAREEDDEDEGPPKSRKQLLAEMRARKNAKAKKRAAVEREKWLARLEARGVEPWPELSDAEHAAAVEELKTLVKEIQRQFPRMMVSETENFLVCTNIPPRQVGPYVASLDAMHEMLVKMFGIDPEHRVWRGKALVVAFLDKTQFTRFEIQFMKHQPDPQTYGLCHSKSNGEVIISCYRGDNPADFGHMLVHETSHGFIHRYKTALRLPTWVNEGMAEWIGQALVPASNAVRDKQKRAVEIMRQSRSMGGLLAAQGGIDAWQYGAASSLNDFMIHANQKAYVAFIEGIKEGLDWQESLQQSYHATPAQLVAAYGRAIGVPGLRP